MFDEYGERKQIEEVPRGKGCGDESIGEHAEPSDNDEQSLVDFGVARTDFDGYGNAGCHIGFAVADIVDIEHSDTKTAESYCGKYDRGGGERASQDEISAEYRHKSEEDKHRYVAKSAVAIGIFAKGVVNGGPDGGSAEKKHQQGGQGEECAEDEIDEQGAEEYGKEYKEKYDAFVVADVSASAGEAVVGTHTVVAVGAAEEVAHFVAHVGKNLQ